MSATVETLDERDPPLSSRTSASGTPSPAGVVTGGIVTVKDSSWLLSWTINRQPQFRDSAQGPRCLVWLYSLYHR